MPPLRVPGKILLTGEYAVLDGAPAIVASVDRFIEVTCALADAFQIRGAGLCWHQFGPDVVGLGFARQALAVVQRYLAGRGFALPALAFDLRDDLRAPDGQKLGLGSSACACVAMVTSALEAAEAIDGGLRPLDGARRCDRIFKLAALAHARAQKQVGSGVDVAASTFGGLILTQRFEVAPFHQAFEASPKALAQIIDRSALHPVEQLPWAGGLLLSFSGKSASTPAHVAKVRQAAERHPEKWQQFMEDSAVATQGLAQALRQRDMAACLARIEAAAAAMDAFEPLTGVEITTQEHRQFMAFARAQGCAAKPSGAGGGDCAVAIGASERLSAMAAVLSASGKLCFRVAIGPQRG